MPVASTNAPVRAEPAALPTEKAVATHANASARGALRCGPVDGEKRVGQQRRQTEPARMATNASTAAGVGWISSGR